MRVNLKNTSELFYQKKQVSSGIAENCIPGHANYRRTIGEKIREENSFIKEKKGRVGKTVSKQKSLLE